MIANCMVGSVLGHYRIVEKLGSGGMGEVYRAEDTRLLRNVAVKVLPAAVADDPEQMQRLEREARALAALNHPNIAHVYGLERAQNQVALVMELWPSLSITVSCTTAVPGERAFRVMLLAVVEPVRLATLAPLTRPHW